MEQVCLCFELRPVNCCSTMQKRKHHVLTHMRSIREDVMNWDSLPGVKLGHHSERGAKLVKHFLAYHAVL